MRQANHQRRDPRSEEAARLAESAAILRRVRAETEPATGAFARRPGGRLARHLGGADADPADRIEVWGARIGRTLSLLALIGCGAFLAWQLAS